MVESVGNDQTNLLVTGEIDFNSINQSRVQQVLGTLVQERRNLSSNSSGLFEKDIARDIGNTFVFTSIQALEEHVHSVDKAELSQELRFKLRLASLSLANGRAFAIQDNHNSTHYFILLRVKNEAELLHELSHVADDIVGLPAPPNLPNRVIASAIGGAVLHLTASLGVLPENIKTPALVVGYGLVGIGLIAGLKYYEAGGEKQARATSKRVN